MSTTRRRKKRPTVAARIISGLKELSDALERGEPLERRFTVRTVTVSEPSTYSRVRIRRTRERIGASQALFARMLGISVKLVEHWESGLRTPSALARRLLDEMNANPDYWRHKLIAA